MFPKTLNVDFSFRSSCDSAGVVHLQVEYWGPSTVPLQRKQRILNTPSAVVPVVEGEEEEGEEEELSDLVAMGEVYIELCGSTKSLVDGGFLL